MNEFAKVIWLEVNGNDLIPEISIVGNINVEIYRGGVADVIYVEEVGLAHGLSGIEVEQAWGDIINRYKRDSTTGEIVEIGESVLRGDEGAVGLVVGSDMVFINNVVTELTRCGNC
jgi:hypothetical protein